MSNELFRRLQMSSPKLAREVSQSQEAMEAIRLMENGRLASEYANTLRKAFPYIFIERMDAGS